MLVLHISSIQLVNLMHIISDSSVTISAMAQQRRVEFADFFVTKYFKHNFCFYTCGFGNSNTL